MRALHKLLHIDIEKRGDLYLLASRPAVGKSTLAFNILQEVYDLGDDVAIISFEMPDVAVSLRMMSAKTDIPYMSLKTDDMNVDEKQIFQEQIKTLKEREIMIYDTDINIEQLQHLLISIKAQKESFSFCLIDYIQIFDHNSQDKEALCSVMKKLKNLAQELDINILINSQLSKTYEKPKLDDLREKRCMVKYIDSAMLLYRQGKDATVQIIKGSNTIKTYSANLEFKKRYFKFIGHNDV
jgi:replicative DNA helicase